MQSDCSSSDLDCFIRALGFDDYSAELIATAFTHSSYTMENNIPYNCCYERLEFLGDAVLKLVITDYLYYKFPEKHEGELTKVRSIVVSDEILYQVAQNLKIENFIRVSKDEKKSHGQKLESIQACVMEALFGALYISSDKKELAEFIINQLKPFIDDIISNKTVYNAKALLQEYTQSKSKELPVYSTVKEEGAAHNKTFTVNVSYRDEILAEGTAKTKKHAQQIAAYNACVKLNLINEGVNE